MSKVIALNRSDERLDQQAEKTREAARRFINQASALLEGLSDNDTRVAWLLSDCVSLLTPSTEDALAPIPRGGSGRPIPLKPVVPRGFGPR